MNRRFLAAGALMALGLGACEPAQPPEPISAPVAIAPPPTPPPAVAPVVAPVAEPPPKPPEWTYERDAEYREYSLIQKSGPLVSGREFEERIMCKNTFEAMEDNMWALQSLVPLSSIPGMTIFLGVIDGHQTEVSVVIDQQRNVPIFLMVNGVTVASCEHSLAYQ